MKNNYRLLLPDFQDYPWPESILIETKDLKKLERHLITVIPRIRSGADSIRAGPNNGRNRANSLPYDLFVETIYKNYLAKDTKYYLQDGLTRIAMSRKDANVLFAIKERKSHSTSKADW